VGRVEAIEMPVGHHRRLALVSSSMSAVSNSDVPIDRGGRDGPASKVATTHAIERLRIDKGTPQIGGAAVFGEEPTCRGTSWR
jgi:hypothetical protein